MTHDAYRPPAFDQVAGAFDDKGKLIAWNLHLTGPSITARMFPAVVEKASIRSRSRRLPTTCTTSERARRLQAAGDRHRRRLLALGEPCAQLLRGGELHGRARRVAAQESARVPQGAARETSAHAQGARPRHQAVAITATRRAAVSTASQSWRVTAPTWPWSPRSSPWTTRSRSAASYCALDCGQQVNPDTIVAQVESSINFGLSALMWGEINIQDGRVQQTNFDSYKRAAHG